MVLDPRLYRHDRPSACLTGLATLSSAIVSFLVDVGGRYGRCVLARSLHESIPMIALRDWFMVSHLRGWADLRGALGSIGRSACILAV